MPTVPLTQGAPYVQTRMATYSQNARDLARMMWNEQRQWYDENPDSLRFAAWAAINRLNSGQHGNTIQDVLAEPGAFTHYSGTDPVQAIANYWSTNGDNEAYWLSLRMADDALNGLDRDPINGMQFFINMNPRELTGYPNLASYNTASLRQWLEQWQRTHAGFNFIYVDGTDLFILSDITPLADAPRTPPTPLPSATP